MIQLFKMAFRDLGRNRRRSFFSALALAMWVALLLLIAAVIQGEMRDAMESSIKLQSGHLQGRAKTYDENKTRLAFEDLIENPERLAAQFAALAPVKAATPRLFASGILSSGEDTMGVRIVGVDTASEANAPFRDGLLSGEYLKADDREGIFIGQLLADKLNLNAGDQVNLMVNTSNGDVDEQLFTIRGLYTTHTPGIDQFFVLMPIAKTQAIVRAPNHASTIFVMLKDRSQTGAVVAALQTSQYQVLTFESLNPLLVQMDNMIGAYMVLIYLIVLAITAAVIVNTLIMAVFERTREIGILSALGMKSGRIMAMFFAESSLLAVGGILMGLFLGGIMVGLASKYVFYVGDMGVSGILIGERIYAYLTLKDTIALTTTAFIVTLLAALYPAAMAARMEPVDAMHGGKQA